MKIFYPAIAILNRLRYAEKFGLITLLFTVPLLLLIILLVSDIDSGTAQAKKELDGTRYLRVLRHLLQDLPELKLREHMYASGLTPTLEDISRTQSRIEDALKALETTDQALGAELQTTSQIETLKQTYDLIRQRLANHQYAALPNFSDRIASDDIYTQLEKQIRALIAQVGDNANLFVDPDLVNYYALNTILTRLPDSQNLIHNTLAPGLGITNRRVVTQGEKIQLIGLIGLVKDSNDALKKGFDTLFYLAPDLKSEFAAPLNSNLEATSKLIQQTQSEIIGASLIKLKPDAYTATGLEAINTTFNLWDQTVNTLDKLLQGRINNLGQKKLLTIGVAAAVLVLVIYFLLGFYLSVKRTVVSLAQTSKRMVSSTTGDLFRLDNRDELGEVVGAFNDIATALISTSAQLQLRQNSSETVSQEVLALAAELKTTANQQASGSTEQVTIIDQVNDAANQSFMTADEIAKIAQQVTEAVSGAALASDQIKITTGQAAKQSEQGMEAVDQTILHSREGENTYRRLMETMQELDLKGSSSRRILEVISEISAETHLLALNAAIEAAGAGPFGERFGVVAREVKSLADRSSAASQEVVKIVDEIETEVRLTRELAIDGYAKAQIIADKTKLAGEVIQELFKISLQSQDQAISISQATQQARRLTEMIQGASLEQRETSQQVLEAFRGLNVTARKNAEGSQLVFATALGLEGVSQTLNSILLSQEPNGKEKDLILNLT